MQNKTILVTGGCGYIGSHACVELLQAGLSVVVFDDLSNSSMLVLHRIETITGKTPLFIEGNVCNKSDLEAVFKNTEIDAVMHFAGLKSVGESVDNPLKYYENNVAGTVTLCQVMKKYRCKKIVFSSSATVYGAAESLPVREVDNLSTSNPYGTSKLMVEDVLRDVYFSDKEWSIAILRYFNPIGAHGSGLIGENPLGAPSNLMPYIMQVASGKRASLTVFGNDYPTVDGTGVRDYIHVVDLVSGHLKALDKLFEENLLLTVNLGTGKGLSVLEMVKAAERATGMKIPYEISERRPGDIAACYADVEKAQAVIGWVASRGIEDMVEDAWRWQKNNPSGYEE